MRNFLTLEAISSIMGNLAKNFTKSTKPDFMTTFVILKMMLTGKT